MCNLSFSFAQLGLGRMWIIGTLFCSCFFFRLEIYELSFVSLSPYFKL